MWTIRLDFLLATGRAAADARRGTGEAGSEWRCTTKPGKLFIHLFEWPAEPFRLDGVKTRESKAYLLADPECRVLPLQQEGETVSVTLPAAAPDAEASVVVLES